MERWGIVTEMCENRIVYIKQTSCEIGKECTKGRGYCRFLKSV